LIQDISLKVYKDKLLWLSFAEHNYLVLAYSTYLPGSGLQASATSDIALNLLFLCLRLATLRYLAALVALAIINWFRFKTLVIYAHSYTPGCLVPEGQP
jgi:hypothetical protein